MDGVNILGILLIIAVIVFIVKKRKVRDPLAGYYKQMDKSSQAYTKDDAYNMLQLQRKQELDTLLDKISLKGIESLSEKEKQRLKDLSK